MKTIHLQAIGDVPAVPVKELKAGDKVMFNYGFCEIVDSIKPISLLSVSIVWRSCKTNELFTETKRITTLVARV